MTNQDSSYNYSLTTQARGKIYIGQSDPRNTALGRAKLSAKYGVGNVIVVPDAQLSQNVGSGNTLQSYSQESFSLVVDTAPPPTKPVKIGLNPPTNLKVIDSTVFSIAKSDGNLDMGIPISFDEISGVQYEAYVVQATPSQTPQAVTISPNPPTHSLRNISVSWNKVSNASNYVLSSTNGSQVVYATAPIIGNSGTITIPASFSAGSYTVTVTPYNSNGYAGPATTSSSFTVA
jgi:hypothetical protein